MDFFVKKYEIELLKKALSNLNPDEFRNYLNSIDDIYIKLNLMHSYQYKNLDKRNINSDSEEITNKAIYELNKTIADIR